MLYRLLSGRTGYFLGFVTCFGMIAIALLIQTQNDLDPCPLCIFQRMTYMAMGVVFLLAGLHHPQGKAKKIYAALQAGIAAIGAGIALRHIWIQSHPESTLNECGAGINYMFQNLPLRRFLQLVFRGTGECSIIDWTLLGFTIPQLSLMAFIGIGGYAVLLASLKSK